MKQPELYQRTVDILYQAYFDDTLQHGNCYACAVGNIIAANKGFKFVKKEPGQSENYVPTPQGTLRMRGIYTGAGNIYWDKENDCQENATNFMLHNSFRKIAEIKTISNQVKATGYRIDQLRQIEAAFEGKAKGPKNSDERMFTGLCAVLEVLKAIHEVEDDTTEVKRFYDHFQNKQYAN